MTTLSIRISTSRKRHVCDQCGQYINAATKYSRTVGTWNGPFQTFREHLDCLKAANDYHYYAGFNYDEGVSLMNDLEWSDLDWLADRHPSVALRLNAVVTPYF